jgi:hypothetical protein
MVVETGLAPPPAAVLSEVTALVYEHVTCTRRPVHMPDTRHLELRDRAAR